MNQLMKRIGIVLSILAFFFMMEPLDALASVKNQMINEECLKNPEACNEEPAAEEGNPDSAVGITAWDYVKMVFALIFVLLLLVWILKFVNKKSMHFQQNSSVQNMGGVSLGGQKSVQVLKIGDTLYVVGVGDNVELIKEITNPEEKEKILAYYNEKQSLASTTPYIAELFSKLKAKTKPEKNDTPSGFGEMLNKRLSHIQKERRNELEKWKEKGGR